MEQNSAIILAAGAGKRMKSSKPKVLCEVLLKPMLGWVLTSCEQAGIPHVCVVTGHEREQVEAYLDGKYETAVQQEQKGTGHAVLCLCSRPGRNIPAFHYFLQPAVIQQPG